MVLLRCSDYALFSILLLPSHLFHSGKFQVETSVLKFYAPFWMTVFFLFYFILFSKFAYFLLIIPRCFVPPPPISFLISIIVQAPEKELADIFPFGSPCTAPTKNSTFTLCLFSMDTSQSQCGVVGGR